MIEVMNWIAQDTKHFLGTVLVLWLLGFFVVKAIHGDKE